jgi:hypothetical protein
MSVAHHIGNQLVGHLKEHDPALSAENVSKL